MSERTPLSDLEKLVKLSDQILSGEVTEAEAVSRLSCDIIGRSPAWPRITGDMIESLSRLVSGYTRHCRLVNPPHVQCHAGCGCPRD